MSGPRCTCAETGGQSCAIDHDADDDLLDSLREELQSLPAFRCDALEAASIDLLSGLFGATTPGGLWLAMERIVSRYAAERISARRYPKSHDTEAEILDALICEYGSPAAAGELTHSAPAADLSPEVTA